LGEKKKQGKESNKTKIKCTTRKILARGVSCKEKSKKTPGETKQTGIAEVCWIRGKGGVVGKEITSSLFRQKDIHPHLDPTSGVKRGKKKARKRARRRVNTGGKNRGKKEKKKGENQNKKRGDAGGT